MPLLTSATILFCVLFTAGYALSHLLYRVKSKTFHGSSLQIKVLMWIPIFALYLAYVHWPRTFGVTIVAGVVIGCAYDAVRRLQRSKHKTTVALYASSVAACMGLFALLPYAEKDTFTHVALVIAFASVLADVFAFFMGNFIGKHHLPAMLNPGKSWEGVAGELIGAAFGVLVANVFLHTEQSWWLIIPIGVGAVAGDLTNSFVKRREGIKDWGNTIPGHGGYLDRFASLGGSIALTLFILAIA